MKEPNILIYFFFPPITQLCSVFDVLFNGGRGVSDSSVLKYYYLNSVNILNECLCILIDCSQLSKTYYNVLFGSFIPRSSCPMHISADVCVGWKSLVKPVRRQHISSCSVLSPEIVMHDNAYIGGRSENNIKCVVHDLGWKNRTTPYILPRHWLYEWFSQFHRCGTYKFGSFTEPLNWL